MIITIGDSKRLNFAFNKRIEALEKLVSENPDIADEIKPQIQEYQRTLNKYKSFDSDKDD